MSKYLPLILVAFGILVIGIGVVYGVVFAGLPGPDDSPAEAARVSFHGSIAFGGVCLGALAVMVGMVAGVIRLLSRKARPRA